MTVTTLFCTILPTSDMQRKLNYCIDKFYMISLIKLTGNSNYSKWYILYEFSCLKVTIKLKYSKCSRVFYFPCNIFV